MTLQDPDTLPAPSEAQMLGELYGMLLTDIRHNRAKRLAQMAPQSVRAEVSNCDEAILLEDGQTPVAEEIGP
jgi:hypothetical protein